MPPVQLSIAPEGYLEIVKAQLAEITVTKPRNNLSRNEVTAPKESKNNSALNLKKADKGTTTVITNKTEKKKEEAKVHLGNRVHYKPLRAPIVKKLGSYDCIWLLIPHNFYSIEENKGMYGYCLHRTQ